MCSNDRVGTERNIIRAGQETSRGTRSIASRADSAFSRMAGGTVTTGERLTRESRTSSRVVSFMFGQMSAREARKNVLPGFSFRRRYRIPISVPTRNSFASDRRQ